LAASIPPAVASGAHVVAADVPDPVHIYGIDFSGGGLGLLEPLPNVGAVIDGSDEERIARLLRWLRGVADERSARYSAAKTPTLSEYRAVSGKLNEPRILVLVDGMTAFRSSYDATNEKIATFAVFQQLLMDGRGIGINFAVSADRANALPTSLAAAFQRKVVLRQSDVDGYANFNLPKDVLTPTSPAGRAIQVGQAQELQLAILGQSVNVGDQSRTIEQLAEYLAAAAGAAAASALEPYRIKSLPAVVPAATMPSSIAGQPVLGVADATLAPVGFDPHGLAMMWGGHGTGRTESLVWFARSLRAWKPDLPMVFLSPKRSSLSTLDLWTNAATTVDTSQQLLERLKEIVTQDNPSDDPQVAVFVANYPDFVSSKVESLMLEVVKGCRANSHFLMAEGESATWNNVLSSMVSEIKGGRTGLMLSPDSMDGESVLRTALPRFRKVEEPPGRGWWIQGGRAIKVQVPLVEGLSA
jgi:S-DNA-T family DNA segregation ATPase FtsK/SpoIIIE